MCVPDGWRLPLWLGGVVCVCWWCAAWGHCPLWVGGLRCWCCGIHVCVCCVGAAAPMLLLVCWWFGGLVIGCAVCGVGVFALVVCCLGITPVVVWCVGVLVGWRPCMCGPEGLLPPFVWWCWCVGGVLVVCLVVCWWCVAGGVAPLRFGVLVSWCVGAHVCVCLRGCCPLWFGGVGVLVVCCRGVAPLCFGGVGRCPLLFINVHKYWKIFEHAQNAPNGWTPLVMRLTHQQQRANTLVCRRRVAGACPLWFGVLVWWRFAS